MLRSYGLFLLDDAAWAAGLLLLGVLLFVEPRLPRRAAAACNLAVLASVSLLLMTTCLVLDRGPWSAGPLDRLVDAVQFLAAFAPFALALSAPQRADGPSRLVRRSILLAFLLLGTMLGASLRSGDGLAPWFACLLALAAAWTWAARQN